MSITAGELANLIDAKLVGDSQISIDGVARIENASPNQVTFIANRNYLKFLDTTEAGAVILKDVPETESAKVLLISDEPYISFLKALKVFHPDPPAPEPGIHPTAVVSPDAKLGENISIGPLCVVEEGAKIGDNTQLLSQVFVGRNVKIGNNCKFYSHVSIREECRIGDRVILQNGVVIGGDGFGFAPQDQAYLKIPQVGIVIIEDDVEIGANTTVDRATLGETIIRKGVKLDNLVQVAHNVEIGENTVVAAQTGIAGSSKIGKKVMMGGQVGISGHIKISDGVMIAAQSGLHKDPGEGNIVGGYPAKDIRLWHRIEAIINRLPELVKRVRKLEKMLVK